MAFRNAEYHSAIHFCGYFKITKHNSDLCILISRGPEKQTEVPGF